MNGDSEDQKPQGNQVRNNINEIQLSALEGASECEDDSVGC